jgi:O-antigen biosynthesis protein
MELSVIIVSFRVRDLLRECLLSVERAIDKTEHEIFVVDNNSDDGSAEMIEKEFPYVKLIINKINYGFSKANNQAIKLSSGRFIVLLNPDTLVEKNTFSKCHEFMKSHPEAGAIGIKMINGEGKYLPESKRAFPSLKTAFFKSFGFSILFPESKYFNRYYLPQININETSLTEVISGAFMFIRYEALSKSGPFDEDFFMYGEDIDLSYRLMQTGYKNYYLPEAQIIHYKGQSTSRRGYSDIRYFYKAMRVYVRKRAVEGKYNSVLPVILSAICLRESFALTNRFIRLKLKS